jgi:hypothetical protein
MGTDEQIRLSAWEVRYDYHVVKIHSKAPTIAGSNSQ